MNTTVSIIEWNYVSGRKNLVGSGCRTAGSRGRFTCGTVLNGAAKWRVFFLLSTDRVIFLVEFLILVKKNCADFFYFDTSVMGK